MKKENIIGFGYEPEECAQHFLLTIPKKKDEPITVYERYKWDDVGLQKQTSELAGTNNAKCKIILSREKWNLVKSAIEETFNSILKSTSRKTSRFVIGQNPIERLLGKELMVLLWAIEDCDKSVIDAAIRNWRGLSREERWWLFTMTNAATGDEYNKRGWRIALRYAITENPIIEKKEQPGLFDSLLSQM